VEDVKPFLRDQFEYPNQSDAQPAYNIDYKTAKQVCEREGKRLCSAQEWEKACKGLNNSIYAYDTSGPADAFDEEFCGNGLADVGYKSGSKPKCKNSYGVFDMSGNFREWTDTQGEKETRRIVKGGLARNDQRGTRCASATPENSVFADTSVSFRCCRDIDAPVWTPPPPPTPPVP
jgi:formylglycine-generating enzyme required for sulfatase activity